MCSKPVKFVMSCKKESTVMAFTIAKVVSSPSMFFYQWPLLGFYYLMDKKWCIAEKLQVLVSGGVGGKTFSGWSASACGGGISASLAWDGSSP
jgi:hypothetical protein